MIKLEVNNLINETIKYMYSTKNSPPINICYGTDDNYARCTGTSITSLCINNKENNFIFHVLSSGLSYESMDKFHELAQIYKTNIIIYKINTSYLETLNLPIHRNVYPISIYYRFITPFILKNEDKIFYLDSDIVCIHNANKFFNIDLKKNILGAVLEPNNDNSIKHCQSLGMKNANYFNSGVLIINVKEWNKFNVWDKLISILRNNLHKYALFDQDALNVILNEKTFYINANYNWFSYLYRNINISDKEKNNIVFIHFAIRPKPWDIAWELSSNSNEFNRNIYANYENLSPWKNTPLVYPTYYKEMKKYAKYLRWHNLYLKSIKWYIKYSVAKLIYFYKR